MGVLVADEKGRVKEHKLGQRSGAAGAGIGLVLAVIAPPTLLAGMVDGGILATSTTGAWGWGTRIARASPRSSPVARPRSESSPADPGSAPVARETPPPVA